MTTRIKMMFAAGGAALMLAGAAPAVAKARVGEAGEALQDQQRQQQRRGGPGGDRGLRGGMRGPGIGGPEFRFLDLTDDQRAQLKKIREARQSEFKAAGEKVRAARQGLRGLIEADSINESAIRAKSQEVAAAEAEVAILNAKVRAESLQILTSEQQAKLKELRANRRNNAKQRPGRRGQL